MGNNHCHAVIQQNVNENTAISFKLLTEIMQTSTNEAIQLDTTQAIKMVEFFCKKLGIKLEERAKTNLLKILRNSKSKFTIHHFAWFVYNYVPKGNRIITKTYIVNRT